VLTDADRALVTPQRTVGARLDDVRARPPHSRCQFRWPARCRCRFARGSAAGPLFARADTLLHRPAHGTLQRTRRCSSMSAPVKIASRADRRSPSPSHAARNTAARATRATLPPQRKAHAALLKRFSTAETTTARDASAVCSASQDASQYQRQSRRQSI
jgi:hypothetical protein